MRLRNFINVCIISVSNCAAIAYAAPMYHVTNLGTLGGSYSYAYAINSSGQVVGEAKISGSLAQEHAFLYSGGNMTDLGTLGGPYSDAYDINDVGQVTGRSDSGGAFLWTPTIPNGTTGTMHDLELGSPSANWGYGINDTGQVTGARGQAFLWTPTTPSATSGSVRSLGSLGGNSRGFGINNSGQVAGESYIAQFGPSHAFLWTPTTPNGTNGTMQDLGTLGATESMAHGINDSGLVVGYFGNPNGMQHAFLYTGGTMSDLGTLEGSYTRSAALAINVHGQVVGAASADFVRLGTGFQCYSCHAFLYSDGIMHDLNTLLDDSGEGWTLLEVRDINDSGRIVGTAFHSNFGWRTVLLAPVNPLTGDYNYDGTVDAADYVVWRKNAGTQADYNLWRSHFGQTAGSGSALLSPEPLSAAVPEPTTLVLLMFVAASWCLRRGRAA